MNEVKMKKIAENRKLYEKNCVVVKEISFMGKNTFAATGKFSWHKLKMFLNKQGAALLGTVTAKTDYLIVFPDDNVEGSKYKAVLAQAAKGHTVKVIFSEDFAKYMGVYNDIIDADDDNTDTKITQEGNRLVFDDAFSIELPSHTTFISENNSHFAAINGFGKKECDEGLLELEGDLELTVHRLEADMPGALKEYLTSKEGDHFILYEDMNVEVALYTQITSSFTTPIKEPVVYMEYNIAPLIRVGKSCYCFQAFFHAEFPPEEILKRVIKDFCSIFNNVIIKSSGECIQAKIYNDSIDVILNNAFALEDPYAISDEETKREQEEKWKALIAQNRKKYEDNCVSVKTIPSFEGKNFAGTGRFNEYKVFAFLESKGAFWRTVVSGKTDYLLVFPDKYGETKKYEAVLEQAKKGHTIKIVFSEDFYKYMDIEEDTTLIEHCKTDTPTVVREDWVITVPAGYMCSVYDNDQDLDGDRAVAFAPEGNKNELLVPSNSNFNFTATAPLKAMFLEYNASFPELPLDHPDMLQYVSLAQSYGGECLRSNSEIAIYYTPGKVKEQSDGSTLCVSKGCVITSQSLYPFRLYDKLSDSEKTADSALKKILLSIKSINEYKTEAKENNVGSIKRKMYEEDCVVTETIPSFVGKTFVVSGIYNDEDIRTFLTNNGAFLRKSISGKTDYLIVSPEFAGDSKYKAVLEQEEKGHTVKIIFYDDFVKYMNGDAEDAETDDALDDLVETDSKSTKGVKPDKKVNAMLDRWFDDLFDSLSPLDIKQEGNKLIFDKTFSLEIPEGIEFIPETKGSCAALSGFCKNDENDLSVDLSIKFYNARNTGELKEALEENIEGGDGEKAYIMLYEDKTVEVAVFIQIFLSAIEMQCNIVPLIRVGKHSFQFQAQYNRSGLALMDALKQDIKEFCSIFNTIKTKARKNSIKVKIDNAKLNKTVEKLFGVDEEADSSLEEHCSEDTPEIVCEEPDETEEQIHQPDEFERELQRISSEINEGTDALKKWSEAKEAEFEQKEREKEELEKKKAKAKENKNIFEDTVLMYMTLIVDSANNNAYSDDDFYETYNEDFLALDKDELCALREKVKDEMFSDPLVYEKEVCALPYDKRFNYSAKCMLNTHNYTGDPNEDLEGQIINCVSRWFGDTEQTKLKTDVKKLLDDMRESSNKELSEVSEDWTVFSSAKSSLFIELSQKEYSESDKSNLFMVKYGDTVGVVQLSTVGVFRIAVDVTNYLAFYWGVKPEEIWNAARNNEIQDIRLNKDDGEKEIVAKAVYDEAMKRLQSQPSKSSDVEDTDTHEAIPEKKEGCYIATAVYGSYNAPEVITLRRFRDETLKKSFLGRLFIKVYYRLSPPVANRLKNAHSINKAVRKILDKWVNRLNEKNKASQG